MELRKKFALWVAGNRGLPYRLRKSIVKKAYPLILTDHKFEIDFYGMRYVGNTNNSTDRLFFMFGGCEKYMLSLLRDYSVAQKNDGLVFLDVGANVGNHSMFMSKYARKIHAFEPNPKVRDSLEANLSMNKIKNVVVHSIGLGNTNERMPFYVAANDNFSCGSFCNDNGQTKYFRDLEVRIGDDVVREKNIKNVDIVKIDVAGFERKVIEGLSKTIERFRPMIIMEISQATRNKFGSLDDFESVFPENYSFYQFSGVSREKETYNLAKFDYDLHDNHLDVIAVPREKLVYLSGKFVNKVKRNKVVGG